MAATGSTTPDWQARAISATAAVSSIRPGDRVFVGTACATPRALVDALERLDTPPAGVVLTHFLTDRVGSGDTRYRHRVFYVGRDIRGLRAPTRLEYVPLSLADVPALLSSGRMPLDVALIQVAPPDGDGMCSLGISVDVTRAAALTARRVIAEVNPAMPRTRGDSRIPLDRIDRLVAVDRPLAEYLHAPADAEADQIAAYVSRLIDDGSTLQVGVGRVPNQMLAHLLDRRDLAIHSDVITEPVVDLIAAGVVTGRVVTSWAMGTRRAVRPRRRRRALRVPSDRARLRPRGDRGAAAHGVGHAGLRDRPRRAGLHGVARRRPLRRPLDRTGVPPRRARVGRRQGDRLPRLADAGRASGGQAAARYGRARRDRTRRALDGDRVRDGVPLRPLAERARGRPDRARPSRRPRRPPRR